MQEEKGTTEDEMVGWHHGLDGHEFEQSLGVGDAQGILVLKALVEELILHRLVQFSHSVMSDYL